MNYLKKCSLVSVALVFFSNCTENTNFTKINRYDSGEILNEIEYFINKDGDSLIDGKYKEYFKNGKLKKEYQFNKGKSEGVGKEYFQTGEIQYKESIGGDTIYANHYWKNGEFAIIKKLLNQDPPLEIGWSVFYDEQGGVKDSVQHIPLETTTFANQSIKYFGNEIIADSSNYYSFRLKESDIPHKSNLERLCFRIM